MAIAKLKVVFLACGIPHLCSPRKPQELRAPRQQMGVAGLSASFLHEICEVGSGPKYFQSSKVSRLLYVPCIKLPNTQWVPRYHGTYG
ncbi:hypothetical protein U0070_014182 [Myodes glareolus]|uniref:Secreted protein n=1 Tax=Myodes glareolus TaxID=447135 RepID=A0AAW0INU1_MYOGA